MSEIENNVSDAMQRFGITFATHYAGETVKFEGKTVDHYRVRFSKQGAEPYDTDFYQGLGNRGPAPKPTDGGPAPRRGTLMYEQLEAQRKPIAPNAASVLYCLLSDAEALDQSFSDWAGNFGYDTDSRKALATYETCCDAGREMRRLFTAAQRDELRDLLQDY